MQRNSRVIPRINVPVAIRISRIRATLAFEIADTRMARKVILDVDPGIDDALAVALALFDPGLEVRGGDGHGRAMSRAQQATINVQTIVELLDPARLPRLGSGRRSTSPSRKTLG